MINESTLCVLAKRLCNVKPSVIIDDADKIDTMLQSWWDHIDWDNLPTLTDVEDDALRNWLKSRK